MVDSLNFLSIAEARMDWSGKRAMKSSQNAIPGIQGKVSVCVGITDVEMER